MKKMTMGPLWVGALLLGQSVGAAAYECEMDVTIRTPGNSAAPRPARDLFVFLDGTGNSADSRTNVSRLHDLLLANRKEGFAAAYIPGVGSTTNPVFGNALGHGMERRVRCGYAFLAEQFQPDDRIFIFGFSRGAHEARNLAGLIAYAGIAPKEDSRSRQLKLANTIQEIVKDQADDDHADGWKKWKPGTTPPMAAKIGQKLDIQVRAAEVAFLGVWDNQAVVTVMFTNWGMKVAWEALLTPVTYGVVGWLKGREGVDVYDEGTEFSPFAKADAV